jgi:hypothetical protein
MSKETIKKKLRQVGTVGVAAAAMDMELQKLRASLLIIFKDAALEEQQLTEQQLIEEQQQLMAASQAATG